MSAPDGHHTTWRHHVDDEIYQVRLIWLGPPGVFTFPWDARYITYGIAGAIFGVVLLIEHLAGMSPGWPTMELAISIAVTHALMRAVTYERPVAATLRIFAAAATHMIRTWARRRLQSRQTRLRARAPVTTATEEQ